MEKLSFHDEIAKNKRNSVILIAVVFVILILLGYVISIVYDPALAIIFIVIAALIGIFQILFSYYNGDKVVLKATGAIPAERKKYLFLHNTVEALIIAAGIPKPKVYIIPSKEINAFATGRDPDHASIAVTQGLLDNLNRQETEGVIAHELGHVANYDIRFSMLVAVLVGIIGILSYMFIRSMWFGGGRRDSRGGGSMGAILFIAGLLLAIFAPLIVRLTQMAISRKREYLADSTGAKITRYPDGLAGALQKIMKHNKNNMKVSGAVSHLFFVNPLHSFMDKLTSTHPPLEERIKRLKAM